MGGRKRGRRRTIGGGRMGGGGMRMGGGTGKNDAFSGKDVLEIGGVIIRRVTFKKLR